MARIVRFEELKPLKGIPYTRAYLGRLEDANKFPRRIALGPNSIGWDDGELDKWIEKKKQERFDGTTPARRTRGRPR